MQNTVKERFLKYVTIDTQANPESDTSPSSEKQKDLSNLLVKELNEMGIKCETNEYGYVYAFIPSNVENKTDNICFCAHVDTAPDCSGKDVKPIVHHNFNGYDIVLPDDPEQVIGRKAYPYLDKKIGEDIVTASGKTLLGSDDKSGVVILMDLAYQLAMDKNIPHGNITLLFTTDEEIGRGVKHVDYNKVNATFGFTLDGGPIGEYCEETFSANEATLHIKGVAAHPGYAKGKMENAIKIAGEIISALPKEYLCPEVTEGYDGFIHPKKVSGELESAKIEFILRDFNTEKLTDLATLIESISSKVFKSYPNSSFKLEIKEQYRNMKEVVAQNPRIKEIAFQAMKDAGIQPFISNIRGGTDGSVLSANGLPCPNLFTGMQAIHSKHEFVSIQDMEKAVDMLINICKIVSRG